MSEELDSMRDEDPDSAASNSEEEYSGKFVVRVPKTLHRVLAALAEEEGTSLNQYVLFCLSSRPAQPVQSAGRVNKTLSIDAITWKTFEQLCESRYRPRRHNRKLPSYLQILNDATDMAFANYVRLYRPADETEKSNT